MNSLVVSTGNISDTDELDCLQAGSVARPYFAGDFQYHLDSPAFIKLVGTSAGQDGTKFCKSVGTPWRSLVENIHATRAFAGHVQKDRRRVDASLSTVSLWLDSANGATSNTSERSALANGYSEAVRCLDKIIEDDEGEYEAPVRAIRTAKHLLSYAVRMEWEAPKISPQSDEAVVLVWSAHGSYRFVTVTDGQVALLAEDDGEITFKKSSLPYVGPDDFEQITEAFGPSSRRDLAKRAY